MSLRPNWRQWFIFFILCTFFSNAFCFSAHATNALVKSTVENNALVNSADENEALQNTLHANQASEEIKSDTANASSNVEESKEPSQKTILDERLKNEREANQNLFSLTQYRQNYLLPVSYVTSPNSITLDGIGEEQIDNLEAKYQISVKTPLWLQDNDVSGVFFGFTAVSFWQVFNDETSKPFRETNYEPEVFYQFASELTLLGYDFSLFRIGINHMSNGQDGLKSRSWNRIIATALFSDSNTAYYIRTWYRLPEDDKTSPLDPLGDDNPDIHDYYGRVELGFGFKLGQFNGFANIRNNLSLKDNRSGITLDATYPINKRYDLLIQYFNGYGDSLIDYNRHQQRISIGVQLRFL